MAITQGLVRCLSGSVFWTKGKTVSIQINVLKIAGKICHQLRIDAYHSGLEDHQLGFQQLDPFAEVNYEFTLLGR